MKNLFTSLKLVAITLLVCCVAYPLVILGFAQMVTPGTANGSLLRNAQGEVVGSRLIAQEFHSPQYFWPRPSAVNYDASAAGGSNLAPTNPEVAQRARDLIDRHSASSDNPIPADLVTASGGGLDPHISDRAARFQIARVASARGWPVDKVAAIVDGHSKSIGGRLVPDKIVSVLALNLSLDETK